MRDKTQDSQPEEECCGGAICRTDTKSGKALQKWGSLNCVLKDELLLAREGRGHGSKIYVTEVVFVFPRPAPRYRLASPDTARLEY